MWRSWLAALCLLFAWPGLADARNNAQFVSQSAPTSMMAGQCYTVSVTMKNTGTSTWTRRANYRLGSQNPQDNLTWDVGRVDLDPSDSIAPGQSKTFIFNIMAPVTPGSYNFRWRMLREHVEWFGGFTPNLLIHVAAEGTVPGGSRSPGGQGSADERPVADRLGVAHVNGKYHFTDNDYLNEGADRLLELGTRVIKVWFVWWSYADYYSFNSRWPKVRSLVELAQTPYYRALFAKPFTTFILETYSVGRADHYFIDGITDAEAADETRQFEELTRYLLATYQGTGKTFVLQNWEGDWGIRGHFDASRPPTTTAIAGMIRWLNARQEGVERARRAVPVTGVQVYHAAEVNLVADAMAGRVSVTNDVLPHTRCDLYSYSAYDTAIQGCSFRAALDYLAAKAPDSAAFGAKNVYVGEFGVPENEFGTAYAVASVRRTIREGLEWGCPYLVYWQIYDNECKAGQSDAQGDCRGFWLIKPSGQKSRLWDVLAEFLRP